MWFVPCVCTSTSYCCNAFKCIQLENINPIFIINVEVPAYNEDGCILQIILILIIEITLFPPDSPHYCRHFTTANSVYNMKCDAFSTTKYASNCCSFFPRSFSATVMYCDFNMYVILCLTPQGFMLCMYTHWRHTISYKFTDVVHW